MSVNVTIAGVAYAFPQTGDSSWGDVVTAWAIATSSKMLQTSGGTFTLTAEVDFGATWGLKAAYWKTGSANPAQSGIARYANNEGPAWRNFANTADLALLVNASNQLAFNGSTFLTTTGTLTASTALQTNGSSVITSSTVTATELSYLSGVTSALQTQLNAKQATGSYITALTTDVVAAGPGSVAATIQANVVTNSKLAQMAASTIKGNNTGGAANAADLTVTQTKALLNRAPTVQVLRSSGSGYGYIFYVRNMTATAGATYTNNANTYTLLNTVSNGLTAYFSGSGAPSASGTLTKSAGIGDATATFNQSQAFATPVGYLFAVTSANATVGATYTNNGNTYTVAGTIAAGTNLWVTGAGFPLLSGTLTKSAGTGDATITFSQIVPAATYTTPANVLYLNIRGVGGGGGGGAAVTYAGGAGTSSGFGVNMIVCSGGLAGSPSTAGVVGGVATIGTGPDGLALQGGSSGYGPGGGGINYAGTYGAASPFGGAGGSAAAGANAFSAIANTGSGGGGSAVSALGASGGSAAGYADCIITAIAATFLYAVGVGGTGGPPGTNSGGDGGSGLWFVEEYYQ